MNIEIAQYRDEDLKDFRYNPLIEALPAPGSFNPPERFSASSARLRSRRRIMGTHAE